MTDKDKRIAALTELLVVAEQDYNRSAATIRAESQALLKVKDEALKSITSEGTVGGHVARAAIGLSQNLGEEALDAALKAEREAGRAELQQELFDFECRSVGILNTLEVRERELAQAQKEVLVLREWFQKDNDCTCETCWSCAGKGAAVLATTAESATKYADKLRAEGGVKALEDAALEFNEAGTVSMNDVSKFLRRTASELHGGGECVIFAKK